MRNRLKRVLSGYPGDKKYWEKRYRDGGTSGAGSYGRLADFKSEIVNDLIQRFDIGSIIDLGCGDGNQISLFSKHIRYSGYDVSQTAIEMCRDRFKQRDHWTFHWYSGEHIREETAVASLSMDVLFHLTSIGSFRNYLELLFNCAEKYVIIYSSNQVGEDSQHVKERNILSLIQKYIDDWTLQQMIENPFPWDPQFPETTSRSNFFIFHRADFNQ